uniref:SWI/SNF-related matrix-associated actin-dependent regulator of chromatin subfamily A member 3-like 3 n=1 Tax=Davidia involucrata TaxID=16924 RepID=A0A5B7BJ23_DAVIN
MERNTIGGEEENIKKIRSIFGTELPESDIVRALLHCCNNPDSAINYILDTPGFSSPPVTVKRTVTSTGARISTQIKEEKGEESDEAESVQGLKPKVRVKEEPDVGTDGKDSVEEKFVGLDCVKKLAPKMSFDEFLQATNTKVMSEDEYLKTQIKQERAEESEEPKSICGSKVEVKVKEEPDVGIEKKVPVKEPSMWDMSFEEYHRSEIESFHGSKTEFRVKEESDAVVENKVSLKKVLALDWDKPSLETGKMREENRRSQTGPHYNLLKPSNVKKERVEDRRLSTVVIEDGDFPEEPDWLLVGRTTVTGLSTTKGRKLENNEIVHFAFPSADSRSRFSSQWVSAKAAAASSAIVRFSTKRSGEIGRLPMEWAKCLIPLVNSAKVKVLGRCIAAPLNLHLMQEIMLYLSFYIHHSIFTEGDKSSWRLDAPSNIDSTVYPLPTLFKLLKIKPFQKAEFTPEELNSRKRLLNLEGDSDEAASMLPIVKRRQGCQQYPEQTKDEQAISESSLNKLVGAVDVYDLEEMEPPEILTCDLRPYQKQALYWMSESEKGTDVETAAKTLHPCWAAYRICDERASAIYVNIFSGEATTQFPTATQMARGGILADAMGLGKTVMTIALILARPGKGTPDNQKPVSEAADDTEYIKKKKKDFDTKVPPKVKGGTLIVCPMALLSQWKDELETHSKPESISIFVHYGGDRTNDPKVISENDVVLTTYGVLTAAYKSESENSIFHRIGWYRVVLDEAHTIKSSRTVGAQAAFTLSSHCRWCLTGTPLQNNLEDLYSLLCFLHVEPWCNWAWWQKLIQRPYENGDPRGLRLIKAILRPLMLRRTKETKDKEGRPILVLPPTDIQVIECKQSEAEHDFYDALFRRSKVQFDQFVAQGKVLHNYANILELLLRLRQCCNHPFLVMSRGDRQEYADLNKLVRRFSEVNSDSATPSRAYIEEVVEGIRRGENAECPICLEYADDPVLTPCAHQMCRECLLSSWRTPSTGLCPICRQLLKKTDLITCPSENRFRVDVEKNWKESSKVTKLLDCLEGIRRSGSGEKSIIFSQWTSFLDLLEIPLKRRGIGFLRFDGKLVQKQRERVLKEFNETREKMVLLMSLKAGGVGLNLTAASNVFLMDPWWNPAVEEQAIMRIHRIGQKRTVSVRRFIVNDTVEERMQQVQARKQRMIAGALTDEEVRSARIEELKMLFR